MVVFGSIEERPGNGLVIDFDAAMDAVNSSAVDEPLDERSFE